MRFIPPSREVLAEVLLAAGPTAPTLCQGWEARHLAAHLVLREHHPMALGIALKPLRRPLEDLVERTAARALQPAGFSRLVERFRGGPGRFSPLALPSVDHAVNLVEYFVHTEDVRRAGDRWAPRILDDEYSEQLWKALERGAAHFYRGSDVGVILVRPDGRRHVARRADTAVAVAGEPAELLLHAMGRRAHALVTFEGSDEAVSRLANADLGV